MNNFTKFGSKFCSVCQKHKGVIAKARGISHSECIKKILKDKPLKDSNKKARKIQECFVDYLSKK